MTNIDVKEFKLKLQGKDYKFRLDFKALLKFNNKYENAIDLFNEFLSGKNVYDTVIKILSCACVNKEISEEELASKLAFNFECMKLIDEVTFALVQGVLSESETSGDVEEKN